MPFFQPTKVIIPNLFSSAIRAYFVFRYQKMKKVHMLLKVSKAFNYKTPNQNKTKHFI